MFKSMLHQYPHQAPGHHYEEQHIVCLWPMLQFEILTGKPQIPGDHLVPIGKSRFGNVILIVREGQAHNIVALQSTEFTIVKFRVGIGIHPNRNAFQFISAHHTVIVEVMKSELVETIVVQSTEITVQIPSNQVTGIKARVGAVDQDTFVGAKPIYMAHPHKFWAVVCLSGRLAS